MTYLLALDQGTSSSRSIVFRTDGSIAAMAQREFRQIYPQPGWVEHDPRELWSTQRDTAREVQGALDAGLGGAVRILAPHESDTSHYWADRSPWDGPTIEALPDLLPYLD